MFEKLEDVCKRYEELQLELASPEVTSDTNRFRKLMKEQSDTEPLVTTYLAYKKAQQTVEESLEMLDSETDNDMREMLKEELADGKAQIEAYEKQLKLLLIPKDPCDDKILF